VSSLIRRLSGCVALTAIVAAGAASHHDAVLAADSETPSEEVVTNHNPFSTASHLHAILRIVPLDPCWACHWSRVSAVAESPLIARPIIAVWKLNALPPRSAISVAQFTRRSRAPPALLSA
jgi:hypothetical protein